MPKQAATRTFQVLNISKGDMKKVLASVNLLEGIVGRASGGTLDGTKCSLTTGHDFHCGDSSTD